MARGRRGRDVPPPLSCEKNSSLQTFWKTMSPSVWILRVSIPESKLKCELMLAEDEDYDSDESNPFNGLRLRHMYSSGVCVSGKECLIMSSSQLYQVSQKYNSEIMGRRFCDGDEYTSVGGLYEPLEVSYYDTNLGIAFLQPKNQNQISYPYVRISDEVLNPGSIVKIIGHPWSVKFPLLDGRITSESCFKIPTLSTKPAFETHKTYTNVADVMIHSKTKILDLDEDMGVTLNLSRSLLNPLLTIQGMYHRSGVAGSAIFDDEGLVRGLVCFGGTLLTYGIPIQHVLYHLVTTKNPLYNHISLKKREGDNKNWKRITNWKSEDVSEKCSKTRDSHEDRRAPNPRNMDNVDHEVDSVHSDHVTYDASTSTLGKRRKRQAVTKRGIVSMKKVIDA